MARSLSARDRRKQFLANNTIGRYGYGSTTQRIFVTDLISEGPIQGLVNGAQSVFLNDDAIFDSQTTNYIAEYGNTTLVNLDGDNKYRVTGRFTYNDTDKSAPNFLQIFYPELLTVSLSATSVAPANGQGLQFVMNWDHGSNSSEVLPTWTSFGQNDPEPRIAYNLNSGPDGCGSFQIRLGGVQERGYVGYFSSNPNNTTKSVNVVIQSVSSDFALANFTEGLHTLNWHTKLRIASISSKEITTLIPTGFTIDADSACFFSISKRWNDPYKIPSKYADTGVQFNTGTINQRLHITPLGVGSNTTQLSVTQVRDLNRSESGRITATVADNASEIDKVRFEFRYPGGLVMHNTENGNKYSAGAGYKIEVRFDTSEGNGNTWGDWVTLDGNFELRDTQAIADLNLGGALVAEGDKLFAHGGKFISAVSFTHTIDLTEYQPYVGFQFRVRRVTNGADLTDAQDGRAHVWDLGTSDGRPVLGWRGTDIDKWQAVQSGGVNSVTGIITEKVNYPYTSIATVSFNASQFDNTPTRTYDAYGLKVKIPSNYTPRERKLPTLDTGFYNVDDLYEGIWDGTFQEEKVYTDNPAWVFYDILINNRYGVGQYVRPSDIDKWSLYKIARYCDELVPDGKGGFEPRFRANVYLAKATDVYKVLKDMATIFRGILYWGDGKLFPVIDDKKYPVYTFNRANVKDGSFNYESTAAKTRTNQMIVQWNNPDANYRLEPLIVEDRPNIIESGKINQEEVTAFGCTSPGQAIRYGRWKLWTAINQTQIVEFTTAYNAAFLSPGDIINIQDNHDYSLQYSGRVKSATTNTLNVDRVVDETASSGQVYVVIPESKVVLSQASASVNNTTILAGEEVTQAHDETGSLYTFSYITSESAYAQINNAYDENGNLLTLQYNEATSVVGANILSVSANELTLPASSFTSAQANKMSGAIFGINDPESSAASLKEYKIVNIVEESDNTYRITAVEYYEGKFDAVDYNFTLAQDDPLAPLPQTSDTVPPPRNVNLRRDESTDTRSVDLFLTWNAPAHNLPVRYSIEHNVEGYPNPLLTTNTSVIFEGITTGGNYSFVLRAIDEQGRRSSEVVRRIYIEDDAVDGTEGTIFGLRKGGYSDARAVVDSLGKVLKFEAGTTVFAPEGGASTERYEFTSASVNFAVLASDETAYVLADTSSSTLKLIKHIEDTNLGVPYWYDRNITTAEDRWVTVSNSVAYITSSNSEAPYIIDTKAVAGEDYTEDFSYNSVIRYKTDQCTYAALATIITPGAIYLDRELDQTRPSNPITQTGALLQKDQLNPDIRNDFIIGEIDGSGNWKTYLVQDPDLQPAKAVNISLTPASLNYDASSLQTNTPSNFTAKITALGFRDPEFRVTLEGFSGTPATSFCSANGIQNAYIYTFTTDDGAVAYGSGSAALITASVREVGNIAEEFSATFEAVKIREGATGEDGRTVSISASNTVFTYNATGTSPSPASQEYEAIAFGTTGTPYFEFFVDGVSQGSPNQTSIFQYTPSASADQMPQTIQVKLYESNSAGAAIASDFTSAIGIRPGEEGVEGPPGTDAFTISIPNSTHTFTASSDGAVLSYSSSGTTIQVYQGTTLLTYSSAATSDAYTISTSAVNITVGTITGQGTGTVIVDDHSAFVDSSDQASIEYTITTSDITLTTEQTFSKSKTGTSIEGPPGDPGLLTATGVVYYQLSASADNPPSTPSATSYTFSTGQFSSLTSNWAKTPPNLDGSNGQYWLSEFNVTETTSEGGTGVPTFSASKSSTNFTNVVVFSDLNTDTSTVIHGGNISTGEIIISNTELGSIRSGKANYSDDNTSGFFLGWDSNCAKFNIGNATQNLKWTGSSLQVAGELSGSVVRVKDTFIFEGTDVQGELRATTLAPGSVTVDSLSNAVLNLIDSRVGISVGATFDGYYLRNATSSTYNGSSANFIFQDGGTGGSASKLRGDGDPEAKLAISHFWTSQTSYNNLTGTAQFQYATSTSGPWTTTGSTINWTITKEILDFSGEVLYLYNLNVSNIQTLTSIPSGTYFWRVVFTPTGGGTNPLSISPAQFEASILEGVSGATATGGSAATATSAVSASAWTIARDFTIGDTTIQIDGSSSATWTRSDIGITKTNIDALGISANFSKSANYAQSAGFATNANFSQSANYAQSAGNAAQLGGVAATNYLRSDQSDTMNGALLIAGTTDQALTLRATDDGPVYTGLQRDLGGTNTRIGYYGFGSSSDQFTIANETGGNLILTASSGSVRLNIGGTDNLITTGTYTSISNEFRLTGLSGSSSNLALMIQSNGGKVNTRVLGSNAFNSTSYLPTGGGTMNGNITFTNDEQGIVWSRNTDGAGILFYNTGDGDTDSRLEYYTRDNGSEYHRWVHYTPGACAHELARLTYSNSAGNLTVTRDITANRNISGVDINASGTLSGSTLSVTANGTITGNLTITGDLDVNGTTTTIDSSVVSVSAKTITVARNAAGSSQADGAGLFVEGPDASILYQHSNSAFLINHDVDIYTSEAQGTMRIGRNENEHLEFDVVDTINKITAIQDADENNAHQFILNRQFAGSGESYFKIQNGGTTEVSITGSNGRVGLGITDPNYDLDVSGTTNTSSLYRLQGRTAVNYSSPNMIIGSSTGGDGLQLRTGSSGVAMTILSSNNNVGIGLTNPSLKLVVDSGTTNHVAQFISTDNNAHISVKDDTTTVFISAENDVMSLGHNAGVNASNLNITPTGSVGIKTSSPGVTLSVSGDIATTHNAATISTRKIGARDTNGLAIATSNGTSHVDLLNSGVLRTNTGLYATGALYVSGIESTSAAILVEKGQRIASDDGNYVRTMLQHTTSNDIDVGQNSTGLIRDINLYAGTSGKVNMYTKSGGTVAALIVDEAGTAGRQLIDSDDVAFYASANNVDFTALRIAQAAAVGVSKSSSFGFSLDYIGSGSGNDNELKLRADNQESTQQDAFTVKQDGTMTIHKALSLGSSLNASGTITGDKFVTGSNSVTTETDILITDNGNIGATQDLNFIIDTDNNNADNKFTFRKNGPGTTSSEELVRITESGNVGIGTDAPAGNLHIKSLGDVGDATLILEADADNNLESDNPRFELRQDNNLVAGYMYLEGNAGATATDTAANALVIDHKAQAASGDKIQFVTGGKAPNQTGGPTDGSVRMTIDGTGQVGIGTDAPTKLLDVAGQARFRSRLTIEDTAVPLIFHQTDITAGVVGKYWRMPVDSTNLRFDVSLTGDDAFTTYRDVLTLASSGNVFVKEKASIGQNAGTNAGLTVRDGNYANSQDGGIIIQAGSNLASHWRSGFKIKSDGSGNPRTAIESMSGNAGARKEIISINASGNVGVKNTSPATSLEIGEGTTNDKVRVWYTDSTYTEVTGYGVESSRGTFYIRSLNNGTSGLIFGGTSASSDNATQDWGRITFRPQSDLYVEKSNVVVKNRLSVAPTNTSPQAIADIRSPDGSTLSMRLGREDNASYWDFNHAGDDLRIYNNDGNGSDILFGVNSGGTVLENKVGIGHATPDKALVVSASGDTAEIVINDTTGTPTLRFRNAGSTIGTINVSASDMTFINASRALYFGSSQFRPFNADTGAIDLGSDSARFNKLFLDNAINFGPEGSSNQTYMQYTRSSGGAVQTVTLMQRHTELGATSFGGDDATIIGAGEGRQTVVSNLGSLAGEQLHLAAESGINFYTSPDNWSSGWAARNEMFFSTSGQLTVPSVDITGELASASISSGEIIATTALRSDLVTGVTYPSESYLDFDDDALPDSFVNGVSLRSVGAMSFTIDSNNNGTAEKFYWLKDNVVPSSATELMELDNDGNLTLIGQLNATTKSFLINHPTKEGMKLRYGSLEGPENGVYVRGRATTNVIELPDYWTGLVDENTITVQLTANGRFQKLFVDRIENNKVYLKNASWFSNKVDCYYNVYGERKDVEKLEVEY